MTLIVLTVVVIALLIAVLAIFHLRVGILLNRTVDDLDGCAQNVKNISYQADVIEPGVVRINETGTRAIGALPLLCVGAESVAVAKRSPYVDPSTAPSVAAPKDSFCNPFVGFRFLDEERGGSGYLDAL
jgi:hypothetical protein